MCIFNESLSTIFLLLKKVDDEHVSSKKTLMFTQTPQELWSLMTMKPEEVNLLRKHQHPLQKVVIIFRM